MYSLPMKENSLSLIAYLEINIVYQEPFLGRKKYNI